MLGCALVAELIVGLIIERGLLKFMYGRDEVLMVIITYALLLVSVCRSQKFCPDSRAAKQAERPI
jgi:branched-subunit amino acid ABC-type transport system permease component